MAGSASSWETAAVSTPSHRAERYARELAGGFAREWRRVLADHGDLWLVIGDRHDGLEWVGIDRLVSAALRRRGFRLQSQGLS